MTKSKIITIKIVSFNILATIIILLVLEASSRFIQPVDLPDPLITKKKSHWFNIRQYDPNLFWVMRPNVKVRGGHLNSLGLRNPEISAKVATEFRMLSLGESSTYGVGVLAEETYSHLLQKEIKFINSKRVQVTNAGVPGHTLFQGFTYLRLYGLALQPDAVLIYFGFNDFLPVAFRAKRDAGNSSQTTGLTDRALFEQRSSLSYQLTYILQKHSNLARLLLRYATPSSNDNVVLNSKQSRVPEADRRWLFAQLHRLSMQHDFRLVIIIPWYLHFEKHVPLLREMATWENVTLIDLPKKLKDLPELRKSYFKDNVHPNAIGHHLITQAIGKELRAHWDVQ